MSRPVLEEARIHPSIRTKVTESRQAIVREVMAAVASHDVVVVGMGINPHPKQARKALDAMGQPYKYLEYGSYLSQWRLRNALKMWTGWPTFPMVFVKGTLVGGANEVTRLAQSGELKRLLGE